MNESIAHRRNEPSFNQVTVICKWSAALFLTEERMRLNPLR
jgi:hypothetical protein